MSYFPMFIELKQQPCLVIGGGSVASRKAAVLEDFGARVAVIAPVISAEIKAMKHVRWLEKMFTEEDLCPSKEWMGECCAEWALVVAATDDTSLNHRISEACRDKKIPVNAVDQIEDCSFIFPAYQKEGEVVAAFSSGGQSPSIAQYLKAQIQPFMPPFLGALAACLGEIRGTVKQCTTTEGERKKIYQTLLELALQKGQLPTEHEIQEIIKAATEKEAW